MGKVEIKLDIPGLRQMRNEPGVIAELQKHGDMIANRANGMLGEDGYVAQKATKGSTRAKCNVVTDTPHAYYSNLKNNTLLRAMK